MEQPELQTKCLLPPHTEEGVLLTQKSAYSPESGFPEAPLHARSPLSTGLEHTELRTRGQLLTSIHPVLWFSWICKLSLESFLRYIKSKSWHCFSSCIVVTVGTAVYEWDWAHVVFTKSPPDTKCWGLIYELWHMDPLITFDQKKSSFYAHLVYSNTGNKAKPPLYQL